MLLCRSHGLPVVHVRQQDVASVPVPDLVCQGGCSRKVIIGFQQMIHSPCQPAHPSGVCEGAGHGARADQDDLRRFLQDRSPRVSSVRECEVGWLLLLHMQYCQDHQDHRCGDPGPHVRRHRSPGQHEPDTVCSCAGTGSRLGIAQSVFSTVYKMCK